MDQDQTPEIMCFERWFDDYFKLSEFDSPDLPGSGAKMDKAFLGMLSYARHRARVPFLITSGYRTKAYNKELIKRGFKASSVSSHLKGIAADIYVRNDSSRFAILQALIDAGFTRIGIGETFIHVDTDGEKKDNIIWTYY